MKVRVTHDAGKDDGALSPGWYAAIDGAALAGPAATPESALRALHDHFEEEHGERHSTPPMVWLVARHGGGS